MGASAVTEANSTHDSFADTVDRPIVLFDAECVLCSANAMFILRHDTSGRFSLASMQSEIGATLYRRHGMNPKDPSSILVIDRDRVRRDSDAVLSIYEKLGFSWRLATVFRMVPGFRSKHV